MRIIINEDRKVAVPTTRFEGDALYYFKYSIMDDFGNLDIYQVGGNYQDMLEYHGFACYHGSDITNYLGTIKSPLFFYIFREHMFYYSYVLIIIIIYITYIFLMTD